MTEIQARGVLLTAAIRIEAMLAATIACVQDGTGPERADVDKLLRTKTLGKLIRKLSAELVKRDGESAGEPHAGLRC